MIIPYNIGDKVLIEVTISGITVTGDGNISYYIISNEFGARVSADKTQFIAQGDKNDSGMMNNFANKT